MTKRRKSLELAWFWIVIGWSLIRIIFAEVLLVQYGINIWIFAAIELLSSPILARASTHMASALRNHRILQSMLWGTLTLASFAAPDVYLLTAGKKLPWLAYAVVLGLMTVAGLASVIGLRHKLASAQMSMTDEPFERA